MHRQLIWQGFISVGLQHMDHKRFRWTIDERASNFLDHIWSVCNLWPFDLKFLSVHLCPQVRQNCKFGWIPSSSLQNTVITNFQNTWMHWQSEYMTPPALVGVEGAIKYNCTIQSVICKAPLYKLSGSANRTMKMTL